MIVALAACFLAGVVTDAQARPRRPAIAAECNVSMPCDGVGRGNDFSTPARIAGRRAVSSAVAVHDVAARTAAQIIAHPEGCPRRLFCGCGAAVRVFGRPARELWLAANWLRFPRTSPAPGMAAARRGHVFVLESHVGGNLWLVTDHNSGGGRSRLHVRSISGFAIVNPHGSSV
jgi:hypothetical protein